MDAGKKRIWIRGQFIEVTDEVYAAYMKGDRKMRYFENDLKTERFVLGKEGQVVQIIPSREDSLDRLMDENAQQFSDRQESVESVVFRKMETDRLHTALSMLTPEEQALIQALFFEEKTERQYADEWACNFQGSGRGHRKTSHPFCRWVRGLHNTTLKFF